MSTMRAVQVTGYHQNLQMAEAVPTEIEGDDQARVRELAAGPGALIVCGRFEGVEEALTRMGGNLYVMDATRMLTATIVDRGEKPAVLSGIAKLHITERNRDIINDAMDIVGGKGICMGPSNFLGAAYMQMPVSITVEGANILTRSLIVFGQGAIRCHPYVLRELAAAHQLTVDWRVVDLEGPWPELGDFDAVLVFNYLDRANMPRLLRLVAPGGLLMMETFLEAQLARLAAPLRVVHGREVLEPVDAERWRAIASVVACRE